VPALDGSARPKGSGSVRPSISIWSESGALERRMAGDPASAFGVVVREGWLDCACQDYGSSHARLPVNHGAGHWTFDESRVASSRRRKFGAWFGQFRECSSDLASP
jgi:hypothetical protein